MATLQENITTIQDTLDDIHDAIIANGGTVLGTDITSYASGINGLNIPVGITREITNQGVFQIPQSDFIFSLPSNATTINVEMYYAFYSSGITKLDLSHITTISKSMKNTCYHCTNLTTVDLSSLTTINSGSVQTLYSLCGSCTNLITVDLSSLSSIIDSQALLNAFRGCTALKTLSFPALTSISFGSYTDQFNNMLKNVTGCTVHFPSNLQSVIGSWSDVTAGFGGTNTTVLFDLPATT